MYGRTDEHTENLYILQDFVQKKTGRILKSGTKRRQKESEMKVAVKCSKQDFWVGKRFALTEVIHAQCMLD